MAIKTRSGPYNPTKEEQEVVITFNRAGPGANVYSTDPVTNRRLDALCAEYPDAYRRVPDPAGIEDDRRQYRIADRKLVNLRKPTIRTQRDPVR